MRYLRRNGVKEARCGVKHSDRMGWGRDMAEAHQVERIYV